MEIDMFDKKKSKILNIHIKEAPKESTKETKKDKYIWYISCLQLLN